MSWKALLLLLMLLLLFLCSKALPAWRPSPYQLKALSATMLRFMFTWQALPQVNRIRSIVMQSHHQLVGHCSPGWQSLLSLLLKLLLSHCPDDTIARARASAGAAGDRSCNKPMQAPTDPGTDAMALPSDSPVVGEAPATDLERPKGEQGLPDLLLEPHQPKGCQGAMPLRLCSDRLCMTRLLGKSKAQTTVGASPTPYENGMEVVDQPHTSSHKGNLDRP